MGEQVLLEDLDLKMSHKMCVMCELAHTVDIMPVGKSLNKFGLLSKEIYHDLHKSSMNEGIKWRGLLHSINFQENKLARLALIELIRIDNPRISEELEKPEHSGQISCICGQRTNGPRLKRSNSMSHIGERNQEFSLDQNLFGSFNNTFPSLASPPDPHDERWKYMSLQPLKSPTPLTPNSRRRSRSLEILRPFTALERETYIPKDNNESSSESESMDDEIDYIFAGISELTKRCMDDEDEDTANNNDVHKKKSQEESVTQEDPEPVIRTGRIIAVNDRDESPSSDDNFVSVSYGFPSSSSIDTVVHVSMDEETSAVFAEESHSGLQSGKDNVHQSVGSERLVSARKDLNVTSENDVTLTSSKSVIEDTVDQSKTRLSFAGSPPQKENKDRLKADSPSFSQLQSSHPVQESRNRRQTDLQEPIATDQNYTELIVVVSIAVCLILVGLYLLPESLISTVIVLGLLQLYTSKTRKRVSGDRAHL